MPDAGPVGGGQKKKAGLSEVSPGAAPRTALPAGYAAGDSVVCPGPQSHFCIQGRTDSAQQGGGRDPGTNAQMPHLTPFTRYHCGLTRHAQSFLSTQGDEATTGKARLFKDPSFHWLCLFLLNFFPCPTELKSFYPCETLSTYFDLTGPPLPDTFNCGDLDL